jgi:hypothetical protein
MEGERGVGIRVRGAARVLIVVPAVLGTEAESRGRACGSGSRHAIARPSSSRSEAGGPGPEEAAVVISVAGACIRVLRGFDATLLANVIRVLRESVS